VGGPPQAIEHNCVRSQDAGALSPDFYDICREYGFTLSPVDAATDCTAFDGVLTEGSCSRTDVVGHCPYVTVNDLYYGIATCDQEFGRVGLQDHCDDARRCDGQAPPVPELLDPDCYFSDLPSLFCAYTSVALGTERCMEFAPCDGMPAATGGCEVDGITSDATAGTLSEGDCDASGATAACALPDGSTEYLWGGDCAPGGALEAYCETGLGGTFLCD
jgi:hypothetical protein